MLSQLLDHPDRILLANELHARPFALMTAPFRASHVAIACTPQQSEEAREHLIALCDRFGQPHPGERAPHMLVDFGRFRLKWERHTEFIAITIITAHQGAPFEFPAISLLPEDWLASAPGPVLAAVHIDCTVIDQHHSDSVPPDLVPHFARQSLVGGSVFNDQARFWGDFRIHEDGFMRFAIRCHAGIDHAQLGRLSQRLNEVETYRAISMLALPAARGVWPRLNQIDASIATATTDIGSAPGEGERAVLDRITELSAEIEQITSANAFRLDASKAYAAIVWRRMEVLSSQPLPDLIDIKAFMMRRYDPSMRSCEATRTRLANLSQRATRVAQLLRTRIEVAMEEQNRALLDSMDRRSAAQLRLQQAVEGFSLVAISYYAISIAGVLLAPFSEKLGMSQYMIKAVAAVPILIGVYVFVQAVKKRALGDEATD